MSKNKPGIRPFDQTIDHYLKEIEKERKVKKYNLDIYGDKKTLENLFNNIANYALNLFKERYTNSSAIFSDLGKLFIKKRLDATIKMIPIACERYSELFPNLCIEEEFIKANATVNVYTYDTLDSSDNITLAIAIWILDELNARGELERIIPLLTKEDELQGVRLPMHFEDSCYDNSVILGLMHIIRNRNDNNESNNLFFKPYINKESLKRTDGIYEYKMVDSPLTGCKTNRQKLDYIMSLLNPIVVERATKRFEEKQWELFERYLKCVDKYRKEELKLIDEVHDALLKQKRLFPQVNELKKKECISLSNSAILANQASLEDFNKTIDTILFKEKHREKLKNMRITIAQFIGSFNPNNLPEDKLPEFELPDVTCIYQLEIDNPYETCFAFFYLLDSGSLMPWLAQLGIAVLQVATKLLPWHRFTYNDIEAYDDKEEYDFDTDIDEELDDSYSDNADNSDNTFDEMPDDFIEEESVMYKQKYKQLVFNEKELKYENDENIILNFPQFVFSQTQVNIPRNVSGTYDMSQYYMLAGFEKEEALLLEKYIALVEGIITKSSIELKKGSDEGFNFDEDKGNEQKEDVKKEDNIYDLKKEIKLLKEEIKKAHDEKRSIIHNFETLKAEKEEQQKQLLELRTMIREPVSNEDNEETKSPQITFPYSAKGRYVVFGGHNTWSKAIKPLLKNVRFIDATTRPDIGLILNADTVWIQNNAIGHSDYYKIMGIVRRNNIKIEYFSYASAEKCAEQLAMYDMKE